MCERASAETEANYPNLVGSGYKKTSESDPKYNCVAWTQGDRDFWWESAGEPGMSWPEQVPKGIYLENYVRLFHFLGFSLCDNPDFEPGYEKLALYRDGFGWFGHVAKQLTNGKWTSKLGPDEDIEHDSLDAFDGVWTLDKYMKRPLPSV